MKKHCIKVHLPNIVHFVFKKTIITLKTSVTFAKTSMLLKNLRSS